MPAFAQTFAISVVQLGRERALAHARRIGLDDAKDEIDRGRAKAHAGRSLTRQRVRGGHIGVGAEVHIQQRALRAFEQDALARATGLVQNLPDRRGKGKDLRRDFRKLRDQTCTVDRLHPQALA